MSCPRALSIKQAIMEAITAAGPTGCTVPELVATLACPHQTVSARLSELKKEERVKEIRATVASLRVDSIAAVGFGMSRSRAASDIEADKLKLNWQSVKGSSQTVKVGDVLSMRGRGRLEIVEITGTTKKGRTGVYLKRYI